MLLKKLIFDNYKTYYGLQEIDLYIPEKVRKEKSQNIILLGGLNGAGKTTILKAILYILFGQRGISQVEYKRLFSNTINNSFFNEGGRECSISLILETDSGEEWNLKVKWYFDQSKRMGHEERELEVKKQGSSIPKRARIDNIEVFNKFIDRIIPYHAAPFFIFDGEEIKDIILRQNSDEMKEAIQKITGMEAYKHLLIDLRSLKASLENKLAKSVSRTKLNNVQREAEELEGTITILENKKQKFLTDIQRYKKLISEAHEKRNAKISQNSKSREVIVKNQARVATQLDLCVKQLDDFLQENIVNILLRDKILKLKKQLKTENEIHHKKVLQNASLSPYRRFIDQLLNKSINPALTEDQLEQIKNIGQEIWIKENDIQQTVPSDFQEIHDISNNDYSYLMNLAIKDKNPVVELINKIEKLQQELDKLESDIRNAPEAVNIEEENERIDLLVEKSGEINTKFKALNRRLNNSLEEKTKLLNSLSRLSNQDENLEEVQRRYIHVERIIKGMEQYVSELITMKATYIKEEFSTMLHRLFRKQDEFGKIEFDINTYTIRLYNDRMQEISIQDRSAGEMQMIASALIWALTKASDLSLPVVIDTPLGRLDSYHRNHLINHYYKELSEQVIILSTDTEITQEYVTLMEKNSYKQYMLDYDENKKYTVIRDGYFNFVKG
ncbi:DNA sulfur modification protein DndD [Priestia megaterium]|uniref:DNA sulfur modification protein DndD n=1 Tax=Priestia megaterium TaxID=1404 RepID=UPI000BF5D965|nr:DNA sulfur modification protein DndD [Priestia megaterium]MDC7721645.1 DNA sulfur modification protein DndD [Priestia megaterium]PFL01733.1 DNA sulfur modification protein DndD [Priestia megaterium]RCX25069.1 DNA sulfur modification protein DndD [Bacillus sp. AG236]TCN11064.1 DNA sulfur modification protein DndD [Bacillus sp. BK006]